MTSYTNWNDCAQKHSDQEMIYLRDFNSTLTKLEAKNWSVVENRQEAFDIWHTMKREYIVDRTHQFPADKSFLSLQMCDYAKIVAQLLASLSYKESSKHRNEPKEIIPSSVGKLQQHPGGGQLTFSSDDDARKAYYESIRLLRVTSSGLGCVMTRDSFERECGLTWA